MRFSLRLNNDLTLPEYLALAQAAETFNFDQFWVSHDLFLRSAPVILTAIANATTRLQIGTGVLNPYTINVAEIAMLAATLDEVSHGRFNLGLAAGAKDFLEWVGLEQTHPLAALRETITALRALWRGDRVETNGTFLNWTNEAYLRFPVERQIPIYLGALSPKMLTLAGELADGVLPLLFPPEHYFTVQPYIEHGLALRPPQAIHPPLSPATQSSSPVTRHSSPATPNSSSVIRPSSHFDLAACIWVSLDTDRAAARRVLANKIAYYGHALSPLIWDRLGVTKQDFEPITHMLNVERNADQAAAMVNDRMLQIGIVGDADDVIARLEPLVAAGVQHLSFGPPLGPDPLTAIQLLGTRVLPHFR